MNTAKYLELAYDKWGKENSPVAKRNLAIAEIYAATRDSHITRNLGWHHVHFGDTPFISINRYGWEEKHFISNHCALTLSAWLETLWSMYCQASGILIMRPEVFTNTLIPEQMLTDVEIQILNLGITDSDFWPIINLLSDIEQEQRRAKREEQKQRRLERKRRESFVTTPRNSADYVAAQERERRRRVASERREELNAEHEALQLEHQTKIRLGRKWRRRELVETIDARNKSPLPLKAYDPFVSGWIMGKGERQVEQWLEHLDDLDYARRIFIARIR